MNSESFPFDGEDEDGDVDDSCRQCDADAAADAPTACGTPADQPGGDQGGASTSLAQTLLIGTSEHGRRQLQAAMRLETTLLPPRRLPAELAAIRGVAASAARRRSATLYLRTEQRSMLTRARTQRGAG